MRDQIETKSRQPAGAGSGLRLVEKREQELAELVARVKADEPGAVGLLYDRFAPEVSRIVWRLVGADSDHWDLVQEIFCRIIQAMHQIRDPESLPGWVRAVAVNTIRNELRRRAWRRRFFIPWSEEENRQIEAPSGEQASAELATGTFVVLKKLPVAERIPFALRHLEDHKLEEVAQICRCSLATAKRLITSAEQRFARLAAREPRLAEYIAAASGGPVSTGGAP